MALARDVLDEAARLCSVPPVASWVSASRDDHVELRGYYYDCGEDIIDRFDFEQEPGLRLTYPDVEDGVEYTAAESGRDLFSFNISGWPVGSDLYVFGEQISPTAGDVPDGVLEVVNVHSNDLDADLKSGSFPDNFRVWSYTNGGYNA